jgi:class 3 adenylate cyclase/pimeloyl-ACP methyl ester carboxylesterase
MDQPETHYAKTPEGLYIAYQTLGEGPTDVVLLPSFQCVDLMWEEPSYAHVLRRLAAIGRLICLDSRGLGASDPVPLAELPTPESWMDDVRVVVDAVGSTTVNLVCHGGARFAGLLFAATYPERVSSLVLVEAWARLLWADDYPFGYPPELLETSAQLTESQWGTGANVGVWAPSRADDDTFRRWLARFERSAWSPASYGVMMRWAVNLDLRSVLQSVRVPTLVLHREADPVVPLDHGRYLAEHIAGARLVGMPGTDFWFFTQGADELVDLIEEFITGAPAVREADRVLSTVLFTDFVASTEHAARLGDRKWTQILNEHDSIVSRELDRHRGRKVNPTGDGMLATFDGPARAVRCAQAIIEAARPLGVEIRAGLHTGEVELRGADIGGIAVHIGARVGALADAGEVLVSSTVKDLVVGSGIEFIDRGEHELKGVPDTWRLYAVVG